MVVMEVPRETGIHQGVAAMLKAPSPDPVGYRASFALEQLLQVAR
jgi:hypothetical protein